MLAEGRSLLKILEVYILRRGVASVFNQCAVWNHILSLFLGLLRLPL